MGLYLTPTAIGYLTQFILAGLIGGYFALLLRRRPYPRHIAWLAGFFAALAAFIAALLLESALLPTYRLQAVFLQNALLGAAVTCLLQFAYHFPEPLASRRREARGALYLGVLYTLWEAGYALFRFGQLRSGQILYRPAWSDYVLLGFMLWVPLSFLRQMAALSREEGHSGPWLQSLRHPVTRQVHAARAFALLFFFVAALSVLNILRSLYLLSVALANLGISLGILLALFAFVTIYLDSRSEATSFMVKLVGLTLTVLLAIMGVVGWVISPSYAEQYRPNLPEGRTLRFEPNEAGGYTIAEIPYAFSDERGGRLDLAEEAARTCSPPLDFPFPFYGRAYAQVYACNDGTVSLGQTMTYRMYQYRYGAGAPLLLPLLADLYPEISREGGVFVRQTPERLVITWERLRGFSQRDLEFTFQAALYPGGAFEFSYADLPERIAYRPNDDPGAGPWAVGALPGGLQGRTGPALVRLDVLPLDAGPEGVLQDYYMEFRQHVHRLFAPLAGLIVVASMLVVGGFPLLFQVILVRPLEALVRGVKRIQVGDFAGSVPVHHSDEIGFLTAAFNALAAKLGDLIHTLEDRVAARTAELDRANAQLRAEIDERERAQAAVIEQQRALAAFGEREHLARELHDGLGQVMGYINVQAQAAQSLLEQEQVPAAQRNLEGLLQAAQRAYADIRAHILGLRETPAGQQDFLATVRGSLQELGQNWGLETHLDVPEDFPPTVFAPAVEEQALRILQEGLANVRRHAQARQVQVAFRIVGEYVQIAIEDDGRGFDIKEHLAKSRRHFGLSIMRERAEQAGGTLEIRSSPGQGTQILAALPRRVHPEGSGERKAGPELRVLLVDDHPLFLDGLRNLLMARGIPVIGIARDGCEAQEKARALHPDVIVMDLNMPRCDGLAATRAIKEEFPETKIVILTVSEDENALFEAIKSGASGYLLKSLEANQFCSLLTNLMDDGAPLAPGLATRVLEEFARLAAQPTLPSAGAGVLSAQQWEILGLVAKGIPYKEIAEQVHLSEKTIKYHMRRILDLLHLENRAQAIAYYQQQQEE
ncbi:MAG: response regulator [Chloroflexia bacterium]|nr:response regulator [Chloroflexia bacterium]